MRVIGDYSPTFMAIPMSTNPFQEFLDNYGENPVKFVQEVIGVEPFDYQKELLNAVNVGERRLSVRSGHGTGKSTCASWLMIWMLFTRFPIRIVVTAPSSQQLFDALFSELKSHITKLPPALKHLLNVKSDRVELIASPSEAFISAKTSRAEQPEALAGVHASGPRASVLLVADEASAVHEKTFEAASGSMSGKNCVTLLLSNPTRTSGTFFDTQMSPRSSWWRRRWSCLDSPLVTQDFVEEMKERYGEESNAFAVRVMGDFPKTDEDTIIPYHLCESAVRREIEDNPSAEITWGLDVSRFGNDSSALCKRKGNTIQDVMTWKGLDLMQLCGRVKAEYDALHPTDQPTQIFIDSIGLGAGCVDRLAELGLPAIGINVSESPSMKNNYMNLRSELWFKLKAFLENRDCKLPNDQKLISEMVSVKYSFSSNGKAKAESKDEMRKRGLASPDRADALCLVMAHDNMIALRGGHMSRWSKPLKRNLRGVL